MAAQSYVDIKQACKGLLKHWVNIQFFYLNRQITLFFGGSFYLFCYFWCRHSLIFDRNRKNRDVSWWWILLSLKCCFTSSISSQRNNRWSSTSSSLLAVETPRHLAASIWIAQIKNDMLRRWNVSIIYECRVYYYLTWMQTYTLTGEIIWITVF